MSKKKKQEKIEKFPIDAEVANFEAKYPSIMPCIDSTLVRRLYETSIPKDVRENGVNWNINANFTVEKKFFLALKEMVLAGDIDLEIAIIEQFMPIGRMLIKKLGYMGEDLDHKVETAITTATENYLGVEGFKSTILQELKNIVRGKKEIPKPTLSDSPSGEETNKKEPMPELTSPVPVQKEEKKLVVPNDGKNRPATSLDQLLRNIDVLKNSPLEDENYLKFLSLKYGYHDNQFFTLEEISQILSISFEKSREYYMQSLQFVKDWFGLQLDQYYVYLKKANE